MGGYRIRWVGFKNYEKLFFGSEQDHLIGTIEGGMIPKVETCLATIQGKTEAAHILDGRVPHVLLLEIFTAHGVGTMIIND